MTAGVLLVAPLWVGAYVVDGWRGVAVMAAASVLGNLLLFALDELERRQASARARERWGRWHG